jgi:hypothetical protein
VGGVLSLLPQATGIKGDVEEIAETGLEFDDSTTGSFSSAVVASIGLESCVVGFAHGDNASFWICECRLAAALALVLMLLLTLPLLDGGVDSGCESKIWT